MVQNFDESTQEVSVDDVATTRKALEQSLRLPESFSIGQAAGEGDCFFDSVAQGLSQIRPKQKFSVKSLRMVCKSFAEWSMANDGALWFHQSLEFEERSNNELPLDRYIDRVGSTAAESENGPIWGRPEIEGRILSREYGFELHVAERHQTQGLDVWTHDRVSATGSKATPPQYDDENTVHIVNSNGFHFEPILRKNGFPVSKLQHLDDELELENMQVDEMLRKLGTLFSGGAHVESALVQQDPCRDAPMKDAGTIEVDCADGGVETSRTCFDNVSAEGQDGSVTIRGAVLSDDSDLLQRLLRQNHSWPFDDTNFSSQPDDAGHELWTFLQVDEDGVPEELRGFLEEEVRLRKYLRDIAQTITSVRDIARKSEEGNFHQPENHDILIAGLLDTTCKALTSWIYYQEKLADSGRTCHHHKLTLLLFTLVARNVECLQEHGDKLGLPRTLYREVEGCLSGLLTTLIHFERMTFIAENVTRVKTDILRGFCKNDGARLLDICDSLLRDTRNCCNDGHCGMLDIEAVRRLRKHLEDLRDALPEAKLRVEEFDDDISEFTRSTEVSLAMIKERLIIDELLRNLQVLHLQQEEANWFHRFLLKRIGQLGEQSAIEPLRRLATSAGFTEADESGENPDIWKKFLDEVRAASELLNAEQSKNAFGQSFTSAGKEITRDIQSEQVDCDADDEGHPDTTCQTTPERIDAEFAQLLVSFADNSSVGCQKSANRIDCKCASAICTRFVTASAQSEIKMAVLTSGKRNSPTEFQSSRVEKMAKLQGSIEQSVDRLINNVLEDFLRKVQKRNFSETSLRDCRNSIAEDRQINLMKSSLRTFYANSESFQSSAEHWSFDNRDDDSGDLKRAKLDTENIPEEDCSSEELSIPFEKMAAREIVGELKGHFSKLLRETFSRIKLVVNKCGSFSELLRRCERDSPLRISLETLVWESLKILRAASTPTVYVLVEKILCTSMIFERQLPYCPFRSISLFDYLRPGSSLGAFIGDRWLTTALVGYFLTTDGDMLIAFQKILEINGGGEFLVNSLCSASLDQDALKKPISKFDEFVDIVKDSRYWKSELWKRNMVALLKNRHEVIENQKAEDRRYVRQLFQLEIFDECNFRNVDFWKTRTNVAAIEGPRGFSLLHRACEVGDGCLVKELLKNNSEVNSVDDDRNTPLHIAAYHDGVDVVETLIKHSAKLNLANERRFTTLHIAASCGHSQIVETLLDRGADIEATTSNGFTPLFFALPHPGVVERLLDREANVNARNRENSTPLHQAARFGHEESAKLLLTHGAKLNAMDNSYGTPLHAAVVHDQLDIVRLLMRQGADIYDVCRSKCTLVHHAAFNGHARMLEHILDKGLKVDKVDEYGMTPLHSAVVGGHPRVVEILRRYFPTPVFVDAVDFEQRTALHYAVMHRDGRLIESLVRIGASVNAADAGGSTPLHIAAMRDNVKAATFLIKEGADVSVLDRNSRTPLILAAHLGHEDFRDSVSSLEGNQTEQHPAEQSKRLPVESSECPPPSADSSSVILSDDMMTNTRTSQYDDKNQQKYDKICRTANIQSGIRKTARTESGESRKLEYSEKRMTDPKSPWAPIHVAVVNNDVDIVRTLLINKGGVDILGGDDVTPLQLAAEMGYESCVEVLLKKGADVNAVSGFRRRTALHFASRNGHVGIIEKLIVARADINCRDQLGNTPLHLATEGGETESAELLLNKGAILDCYNDEGNTPLHIATIHGHCPLLEMLLKRHSEINSVDAGGCTPLSLAVQRSRDPAIALLLSRGADTGIRNKDGWTPLHLASQNNRMDIVETLLDSRAEVNICGKDNFRPLHLAVVAGSLRLVGLLLSRGADVNAQNQTDQSPLHVACQTGDRAMVRSLLDGGANTEIENSDGFTALLEALQNGHPDIVRELISGGANVECYCKKHDIRPIYAAIASRRLDILKILVDGGADVNFKKQNHITPLWFAAFYGFPEAIRLLLGSGANVNAADQQNNTALHIAARGGHLDVVRTLLLKDANVDALNIRNWTPLHEAIDSRRRDVVASLLEHGASLDIPMEKSLPALHLAAGRGDLEIVRLLDTTDADVNARDRGSNKSPLHHAVQNGHSEVARFLISNGANVNASDSGCLTPLRSAIEIQNLELVNLLLDNEADVNVRDDSQVTPLQVAVKNGADAKLIQVLLDYGAEVNFSSREQGSTTLHLAVTQNNIDIAEVLLKNGADVNSKTDAGATPLHVAAGRGHSPLVKMLIESFADVNCSTTEGLTPLHEAAGEGHLEVVNILADQSADIHASSNRDHSLPLHCAACEGHHEVIESLLDRGAAVDAVLKSGKTALYLSAEGGRVRAVKTLLQHGANLHSRTADGSTMLHAAAISNDVEIIQLILKAMTTGQSNPKPQLEATNDRGDTALILAAWSKMKMSVDTLLKLGAGPNARNCRGFTGLHYAARNGDKDVVDVLCAEVRSDKAEMDNAVDVVNNNVDAALHLAIQSNHFEVVETLLRRGASVQLLNGVHFTPLHLAAEKGFGKILEILCQFGADVDAANNADFFTPLHLAAMDGHAKAVKILMQNRALVDPAIKGYDITPLYLAAQNGHAKAAKILLDNGANPVVVKHPSTVLHAAICSRSVEMVKLIITTINGEELVVEPFLNAVDYAGDTPLMWAAQAGALDICRVLLNYGAGVHLQNEKKMTALHWAATKGHPDVVKLLLRYRPKRDLKDVDGNTPLYLAMCGKALRNGQQEAFDRVVQLLSKK